MLNEAEDEAKVSPALRYSLRNKTIAGRDLCPGGFDVIIHSNKQTGP